MLELKGVNTNSLYNKDNKIMFIAETYGHMEEATVLSVIRTFNKMGEYEFALDKDFHQFTWKETVFMFEKLKWTDRNTFLRNSALLRSYIGWCEDNGKMLKRQHPLEEIDYASDLSGSLKFELEYVKDFQELLKVIETLYGKENTHCIDANQFLMAKAVLCLIWLGFEKDEIALVQKTDVNEIQMSITSKSYIAENIDPYVISLCKSCIKTTSYVVQGIHGKEATKRFEDNAFLIRNTVNKRRNEMSPINSKVFIFNMFVKLKELALRLETSNSYYGKNLKYTGIYWSGVYDRLYQVEQNQGSKLTIVGHVDVLCKIARIEKGNKTGIQNVFHNYQKWKRYFYGGKDNYLISP